MSVTIYVIRTQIGKIRFKRATVLDRCHLKTNVTRMKAFCYVGMDYDLFGSKVMWFI